MALDTEKFAKHLRKNAGARSKRQCARYVRLALQAGGGLIRDQPADAKDYGPTLRRMGFSELKVEDPEKFKFMKGDIVVIQPYIGGNPSGHIAAFDGRVWISDFIQRDFWSGPTYREKRPIHAFYRP